MGPGSSAPGERSSSGRSVTLAVGLLAIVLLVDSCGWGAAEQGSDDAAGRTRVEVGGTAPVLRYVAAPAASVPDAVPDPRCRAARRLFLRAAVASSSRPFVVDADTSRLLDQVEVLATGEARADLGATRAFVEQFLTTPRALTGEDLAASVDRMDRLLVWAITVCPPPQRPVWGCSTQIDHPHGNPFQPLYFGAVGQLVPADAVDETLGEVTGERVELARSANRVVFGWLDTFGLVRRRAEVRRILDLWFVVDAKRCDDPLNRPHPLDSGEVIVEELPDIADGPEYAPTTSTSTTTTTLPIDPTAPSVTLSPTVPYTPCRWDPDNTTDEYETLGEYMANGPADNGCWSLLTPAGKTCLNDPPSGEFFACFDV